MRLASDLLFPLAELQSLTRSELVDALAEVGLTPVVDGRRLFWVEGACDEPEPNDDVTVLRQDGESWVVGYWERGSFRIDFRCDREHEACRYLLHDMVSHHTTSMGSTTTAPYVRDEFRPAILAALAEVTALVQRRSVLRRDR